LPMQRQCLIKKRYPEVISSFRQILVEVKKVGIVNTYEYFAYSRIDTCEHILNFLERLQH
jgi:hypothetical protein